MKTIRQEKINYLRPDWAADNGIIAGFTTRNGGVSRPPFNSLNLGLNTDDLIHNVEANRSSLVRSFGVKPYNLLTVSQVHGDHILLVDEANPDLSHFQDVECDAVITNQPGIMVGILVADCVPVLFFDPVQKVAATVHVGWRGAANGILGKTVEAMRKNFDCRPEQVRAAIGPGIGAHKYEVDRPVRKAFRNGSGFWERVATERELGKWLLDLPKSCRLQLAEAGVCEHLVEEVSQCTCCHKEIFFSYRRDKGQTGRQMGFVMLPV